MSSWVPNKAYGEKNPKKESCNINILGGIFAVPHLSSCCRSLMCLATLSKGSSSARHRLCLGQKCCLTVDTTSRQEMAKEKKARNWAAADHPAHLSMVTMHQEMLPVLALLVSSISSMTGLHYYFSVKISSKPALLLSYIKWGDSHLGFLALISENCMFGSFCMWDVF